MVHESERRSVRRSGGLRTVTVAIIALLVVVSVLAPAFAVAGVEASQTPHDSPDSGNPDAGPRDAGPPDSGPPETDPSSAEAAAGTNVTLVTGQTVTVVERDGQRVYRVDADAQMQQVSTPQGTLVFPTDVDFDTFAPHLFNVDLLIEQNLTDAESDSIPIIVKQRRAARGPPADALRSISAVDHRRTLRSIDSAAGSVEKARAVRAYERLARSDAVGEVTLDIKHRIDLDNATSQVSASAARTRYNVSGENVTVAVIDTGIDDSHPDLNGSVVLERDFTDDGTTADEYGHGTHVAGILAGDGTASNGTYTGVAPNASLINAKVLNSDGWGYTSWVIDGMEYSVNNSADVLSMSLGGSVYYERTNDRYYDAVQYAADNDVTVVASAGNAGSNYRTVGSPAIHESVITVGATNDTGEMAWFSSRGPTPHGLYVKPDVVAPGVGVTSAASSDAGYTDDYVSFSGTSMSAPVVSGTAALVLDRHPNWSAEQVKSAVTTTADPIGPEDVYTQGAGQLNASDAVEGSLLVAPGTVDFGSYTTDTTASRVVTVTNLGGTNDTVNVSASAENVIQNDTAPVSVNRTNLTLSPGESADLELTVNTSVSTGPYSGRLSLDGNEHTAIFGFVRVHEVVVEKRAIGNGSIDDDYVWLFSDRTGDFETDAFQGFEYVSNGTVRYEIVDGGEYHILSPGYNEDNGQPVVMSRQVTISSNRRIVLDEQDTAEHSLDASELNQAHGPMRNLSVQVTAHKTTSSGPSYWTSLYADAPDTGTARFSADTGLNASTKQVVVPETNGSDAYDVPAVYHLLHVAQGVSGDRVDYVNRSDLASRNVTYYRTTASETYDATLSLQMKEPWVESAMSSTTAGVGDRRTQTVYLTPEKAEYELAVNSSSWRLNADRIGPVAPGETMETGVNDHPYASWSTLFFDNESGDHSVTAWAYPQVDAGPDFRYFQDEYNDTATLRFNGTAVRVVNETDGLFYFEDPVEPGTDVELEVIGRNDATALSKRTVTTASTTYDPTRDNTPPVVDDVSADRLDVENTAPNGTVVFRFDASDYESNVTDVEALASNDSVDTVPFTDSGTNPDGAWVNATVEPLGGDRYEARAELGNYTGTVNVAVWARNDNGSVTEITVFDGFYVEDVPPEADFETNVTTISVSRPVEFDGTATWENHHATSYEWTFHDGTTATGPTVERTYDELGNYSVELTVTDTGGYTDTVNRTVVVSDAYPPNASLTANATTPEVNLTEVSFDASNSTDNNVIDYYLWDFDGDGTVDGNTTTPNASYVYEEPGSVDASVTVMDEHDNRAMGTASVTVEDTTAPDAGFAANETQANVSEAVGFDAEQSTDNHRIAAYAWTFGDGANASGETADHAYADLGTYTVTLSATDPSGNEDTVNATIEVVDEVPPNASVTANASTVEVNGSAVGFDARNSTDNHLIDRYEWDYDGDGTVDEVTANDSASHVYEDVGTFDGTVIAVDSSGNRGSASTVVTVEDTTPPNASASANATSVDPDETVEFDARNSTDNHLIDRYEWDYDGDGTVDTNGETVTHSFVAEGGHEVVVTTTDPSGNSATDNVTVHVADVQPVADAGDNQTVVEGTQVSLNGTGSYDPNGGTLDFYWEQIDGKRVKLQNETTATPEFEAPKTNKRTELVFEVTVTDEDGETDTDTVTVYVDSKN